MRSIENVCDRRGSVTKQELLARLDQFATLATRLEFLGVAPFSLGCHANHACHAENNDESENLSKNKPLVEVRVCFQWLAIALDEGHLEPSQPVIGKATGWPQKLIAHKTLWIEFSLWFTKQGIRSEKPEKQQFYNLLDQLFIRKGDHYEIPPLKHCIEVFNSLRGQYECD